MTWPPMSNKKPCGVQAVQARPPASEACRQGDHPRVTSAAASYGLPYPVQIELLHVVTWSISSQSSLPCWCSRVAAPRPVGPPPTIRTETCGHRRMSSCRESTKAFSGPYLFCFWHSERRSRYRCLCSCQTSRLAALSAKRCNTSALQLFKLYIRPGLRGASDVIGVSHCGVRKAVNMIAAAVLLVYVRVI